MEIKRGSATLTVTLPSGEKADLDLAITRGPTGNARIEVAGATVDFDAQGNVLDASDPDPHLCNGCGLSYLVDGGGGEEAYGLIDAGVSGGYSSVALQDCLNYSFSLCEWCLDAMFSAFQLPPRITSYMGSTPPAFIPAADRVAESTYNRDGRRDAFFAEKARRDEARTRPRLGRYNPIEDVAVSLRNSKRCVDIHGPRNRFSTSAVWRLSVTDINGTGSVIVEWSPGGPFRVFSKLGEDHEETPDHVFTESSDLLAFCMGKVPAYA